MQGMVQPSFYVSLYVCVSLLCCLCASLSVAFDLIFFEM